MTRIPCRWRCSVPPPRAGAGAAERAAPRAVLGAVLGALQVPQRLTMLHLRLALRLLADERRRAPSSISTRARSHDRSPLVAT
jgi:hypothetical protein